MAWKCEDCRYFEATNPAGFNDYGECRRHPPTVTSGRRIEENRAAAAMYPGAEWPTVEKTGWCGEWVSRDEKHLGGH